MAAARRDVPRPAVRPEGTAHARRALRATRLAAGIPAAQIAAVAGVRSDALIDALAALPGRGRCAQAAAAAIQASTWRPQPHPSGGQRLRADTESTAAAAALASAAAAPPQIRATVSRYGFVTLHHPAGPGGWALPSGAFDAVTDTWALNVVARTLTCPLPLLRRCAASPTSHVRAGVAQNPGVSKAMLLRLASDTATTETILYAALRSPRFPPVLLHMHAAHPSDLVRISVAHHPQCAPRLLRRLSRDPSEIVRAAVAAHPACPQGDVRRLRKDRSSQVRTAVLRRDL